MPFDPSAIQRGLQTGASIPNKNTGLSELIRTITRDLENAKAEGIKNRQENKKIGLQALDILSNNYEVPFETVRSLLQYGDLGDIVTFRRRQKNAITPSTAMNILADPLKRMNVKRNYPDFYSQLNTLATSGLQQPNMSIPQQVNNQENNLEDINW